MRRLAPTVLLALLAACTVTTTGAPCGSDLECPTGQGCGSDGRCSVDALSCPGHTLAGQCRPGITCAAGQLVTCTAGSGVCSNGPTTSACPAHEQCTPSATSASCACSPTRCGATTSGFCGTGGQIVSCAQDSSSSKACWYESSSAACGDPGATCVESGGGAACACPSADACTQLDARQCSPTGNQVQRCRPVVSGSACLTWQAETTCSDPGTTCVAAGGSAACTCPAANACAQPGATQCNPAGDGVLACQPVVAGSACLTWQASATCSAPGTSCVPSGGGATCACPAASACTTLGATQCNPAGDGLLACQPVVAGSACLTWQASTSCSAPGTSCVPSGGGATCACPTASACTTLGATQCNPAGDGVLQCRPVVAGSSCLTWQASATCSTPGTICVPSGGGATCGCPTANACPTLDATRCSVTADQVQRCQPVVSGSACLTWQTGTNCAGGGLVCNASACVCPTNSTTTFLADPIGGTAVGSAPHPTGIASPATCRYLTLTDALTAANALGSGSTVKAAGWSASTPGGVAVFSEPGALAIGAGVTVTTDDSPLTTSHYAVATPATLAGPFVSLAPGGALSGYEVRNGASTGPGVQTTCPGVADVAPVSLSTVRVAAASGGTPAVRFSSGVHVAGYCPATLAGLTVDGAVTGILVESAGPPPLVTQSTASASHVTNSTSVGVSVVEGMISFTGGTVDLNGTGVSVGAAGTGAPSFSATGTTFSGNTGDAIYVGRGTFSSDGCPYVNNGTHVHAQPVGTSAIDLTVQNSSGAAKMTGATNSAFRLLAMGSGSTLVVTNNAVSGNDSTQSYNVSSGMRRGGGVVLTAPFPGTASIRSNAFYGNKWDQVLIAASAPESLDISGGLTCGPASNTFACYDPLNPSVGLYSNGASIAAPWNHWTRQPGVFSIDVAGSGITGYDTSACAPATLTCP